MNAEVEGKVKIYTRERCIGCRLLKLLLQKFEIEHTEIDMTNPEAIEYLLGNNINNASAPILQIDKDFYADIDMENKIADILKIHGLLQK